MEEQTFFLLKKEEQNNEFSRSKVENEGKCTLAAVVLKLLTAYTLQHKLLLRALYLIVYIFKIIFLLVENRSKLSYRGFTLYIYAALLYSVSYLVS